MSAAAPRAFGPSGRLRRKLAEPRPLLGMGVTTPLPAVVEMAGTAGFDYVFIDLEHTTLDLRDVEHLVRAAELVDVASIVRVPALAPDAIRRVLEVGADAVKVPHVTSADEARAAVAYARFPPEGVRGTAGFVRAAGYKGEWPGWIADANRDVCVDVMVEDVAAVEDLDAILGVPGVDLVSFGQMDYCVSLGAPGAVTDPRVDDALRRIVAAARRHGQHVFTIVLPPNSVDAAQALADEGVKLLTFGNELTHLHGVFGRVADEAVRRLR